MAYVISVCGSGGKTTLCKYLAKKYANQNKKVCITTTTHMWYDEEAKELMYYNNALNCNKKTSASNGKCENKKVCYAANIDKQKQLLTPLNANEYNLICEEFDYVIIEADGSRSMPLKIPKIECEPVIPNNTNKIIIVVGMEAVGREIGSTCHRFNEFYTKDDFLNDLNHDTIVTEDLINKLVNHYYYEPLKKKYINAEINIYKNDFNEQFVDSYYNNSNIKVAIVLLASGSSKRFGENKLLIEFNGKKLYQIMIEKLLAAKKIILEKLQAKQKYKKIVIDVIIVSKYDVILNDINYKNKTKMLLNEKSYNGQSESVKIAVNYCKDYDSVVFVNADLPLLPENEIGYFAYNSILNKNNIASMFTDKAKNPAYFGKEYFNEILKLNGDVGPKELLNKNFMKLYKYYINQKYLKDIDTKEDYNYINELLKSEHLL